MCIGWLVNAEYSNTNRSKETAKEINDRNAQPQSQLTIHVSDQTDIVLCAGLQSCIVQCNTCRSPTSPSRLAMGMMKFNRIPECIAHWRSARRQAPRFAHLQSTDEEDASAPRNKRYLPVERISPTSQVGRYRRITVGARERESSTRWRWQRSAPSVSFQTAAVCRNPIPPSSLSCARAKARKQSVASNILFFITP